MFTKQGLTGVESLRHIDTMLFLLINRYLSVPLLDPLFIIITDSRFWIILGLAVALLLIKKDRQRTSTVIILLLLTVAISDPLCNRILKPLFNRPRPCHPASLVEGGRFLLGMKRSLGMPSSHAMNSFALAVIVGHFYARYAVYFFFAAGFVGYSRIYVGVHYPADVVAGALFGIATGNGVLWFYYQLMRSRRQKSSNAPPPRTKEAAPPDMNTVN